MTMNLSAEAAAILALITIVIMMMIILCWRLCMMCVVRPWRVSRRLQRQHIKGLSYRFVHGNIPEYTALNNLAQSAPMPSISHDIVPRVMPHYNKWSKLYGEEFYHWYGWIARLFVLSPDLIKQVMNDKSWDYVKQSARPEHVNLLGQSLPSLNGDMWEAHRKVVNHAFRLDKFQVMVPTILDIVHTLFDEWERSCYNSPSGRAEVEVNAEYVELAADIIACTTFGDSYTQGKKVFDMQRQQAALILKIDQVAYIPGSRFLPTCKNRLRWRLDKQVQKALHKIVKDRKTLIEGIQNQGDTCKGDLLSLMLMANKKQQIRNNTNEKCNISKGSIGPILSEQDVVNECKAILFAGHEPSSSLLTWTTMLLAHHTKWQDKARAEICRVCRNMPLAEAVVLGQLKDVTMILYESLRLYPPVVSFARYLNREMKLGGMDLPKGMALLFPILVMHHRKDIWGDDANEFRPERFAGGVASAAKHPMAFMPFTFGPRVCVGQQFALLEAKIVIASLLQRFTFHISPSYKHAPIQLITIQPQHGMQIILCPLSSIPTN